MRLHLLLLRLLRHLLLRRNATIARDAPHTHALQRHIAVAADELDLRRIPLERRIWAVRCVNQDAVAYFGRSTFARMLSKSDFVIDDPELARDFGHGADFVANRLRLLLELVLLLLLLLLRLELVVRLRRLSARRREHVLDSRAGVRVLHRLAEELIRIQCAHVGVQLRQNRQIALRCLRRAHPGDVLVLSHRQILVEVLETDQVRVDHLRGQVVERILLASVCQRVPLPRRVRSTE